jgi:hypothetical protein
MAGAIAWHRFRPSASLEKRKPGMRFSPCGKCQLLRVIGIEYVGSVAAAQIQFFESDGLP